MSFWSQKVVVISGAASGIGAALARQLGSAGARLYLCDVDTTRLAEVHGALQAAGVKAEARVLDVANLSDWQAWAADIQAAGQPADVVINNAGVSLVELVRNMAEEDARWIMGINFWGVFNGCKAFLPQMGKAGRGTLVNISSIFAMVSMPSQSMYNATKAAVRGFSDALREEVREAGIKVLCVHPGGVKTRIVEQARMGDLSAFGRSPEAMKRDFQANAGTTAESAARQIIAAIERGERRLLIGKDARVLDWMFRLVPATASARFTALARRRTGMTIR